MPSSISSHNSHNNNHNKSQQPMAQAEAISALWGCASNASTSGGSTSGCSSGSGSQPSLSPTTSHSKELLWAQTSPNGLAQLRENFYAAKELLPHAASPTASLTSSSGASSSGGWGNTNVAHYGKLSAAQNIWELPTTAGNININSNNQNTAASLVPAMFSDLLCNLHISQDGSQLNNKANNDVSDVSSNSSSSAGELLEAANIWRHSNNISANQLQQQQQQQQQLFDEPLGGAAACMQLFNDYLNMNN
ncbi:GH19159 [Drosophila grimshawi]|uniref:GH19159 n=1 Tax=Drosophila grimshawi TaxID=7222 RepID=B4JEP2_DROGR|nr:GH19159 [Drosophila grimshawi]